MNDDAGGLDVFKWAVGIMFSAFGIIFSGWNLHILKRVDDLKDSASNVATAGDDKLWQLMETRHQQSLAAMETLRTEQQRGHAALATELHQLRDGIAADQRHEMADLRAEIRSMKGAANG